MKPPLHPDVRRLGLLLALVPANRLRLLAIFLLIEADVPPRLLSTHGRPPVPQAILGPTTLISHAAS